jgi:hypothetical protein
VEALEVETSRLLEASLAKSTHVTYRRGWAVLWGLGQSGV